MPIRNIFLLLLIPTLLFAFSGNGSGTEVDPYQITTIDQLQEMGVNLSAHYRLMNDINASETKSWNIGDHDYNGGTPDAVMGFKPIGDFTNTFTGSFNGGGYTIDSLFINQFGADSCYVGMFGYIKGAVIDSVILTNMNITGYKYTGGAVGYASDTSTVKNSSASGTLSGYRYVGGVLGYANNASYMNHLSSSATVYGTENYIGGTVGYLSGDNRLDSSSTSGTVTGINYVGGFLGYNSSRCTVSVCTSSASVTGVGYIGNLIGYMSSGLVTNSQASGTVSGNDRVGGIVGRTSSARVENCWSSANITAKEDAGGIVGETSSSSVIACRSSATVYSDSLIAGGIIGENSYTDVFNCYFDGAVSGDLIVGGGIGRNSSASVVMHCYSSGTVSAKDADSDSLSGFIAKFAGGSVFECYWNSETAGVSTSEAGEAKTSAEMHTATTFANWSKDVWSVTEGSEPILFWEDGAVIEKPNGSGTEADPYQITTLLELQKIIFNPGAHYRLMNDIDASDTKNWNVGNHDYDNATAMVPMGFTPIENFTGSLNGGGYTISGLYIFRPEHNKIALFSDIDSAVIDSVHLRVCRIEGQSFVAALAADVFKSEIRNCSVLSADSLIGYTEAGGLIGVANYSTIQNCYADIAVNTERYRTGGLIGKSYGSTVKNSYARGNAVASRYVGGLIGTADTTVVTNCFATGNASASVGTFKKTVGGLIGYIDEDRISTIENCYSIGAVVGDAEIGGLIGLNTGASIVSNCYWDTETSGLATSSGGTGLTTVNMQDVASFSDWNFVTIWYHEDDTYPQLRVGTAQQYYAGLGTADNPYQITNVNELQAMQYELDAHYRIMNDIDASGTTNWKHISGGTGFEPVGSSSDPFTGSLNGGGYTISALYLNRTAVDAGLFGSTSIGAVDSASIDSVHLLNCTINSNSDYVGALVGSALYTNIRNCSVVSENQLSGSSSVGGLVGAFDNGEMSNCYTAFPVKGEGESVGGLIGIIKSNGSTITDCYTTGAVNGVSDVGGLIGWSRGTIIRCYATGDVFATEMTVGGLFGSHRGEASLSYAKGNVESDNQVGGFVGQAGSSSVITNCYATGETSAMSESGGGFVGENLGSITNCFSIGFVEDNDNGHGGFAGNSSGTITDCYFDSQTTKMATSAGGTAFSTAEMMAIDSFPNFSFPAIWAMDDGTEYPMLRWTTAELFYTSGVNGSLTGDSIQYVFIGDSSTTITAVPDNNYHVDSWSDSSSDENFKIAAVSGDTSITVSFAQNYANGDGTLANPYQITTVEELQYMKYDLDAHYRIMNNIDARDTKNWNSSEGFEPVGTVSEKFIGSLRGGGFSIDSLYIERQYNYVGLIGYATDSAVIDSVHLTDVFVESGSEDIAGLVGLGDSVFISDCSVTGTIYGAYYVGALIGELKKGELTSCWADATVEVNEDYAGVLAGYIDTASTISQSYTKGTVKGYTSIGGLVGYSEGDIEYSRSESVITGDNEIGGLIGTNKGKVYRSYATGAVTGTGKHGGGLIGLSRDSIVESYATGSVTMVDRSGGLVGESYGKVLNSYATGAVDSKTYGGGLVGFNSDTIINCYSIGVVTDYGTSNGSGGLVGLYAPRCMAINSYVDTVAAQIIYTDQGVATDTSVLYHSDSLTGWDFASLWCMDNGTEYPLLRWTAAEVTYTTDGNGTISGDSLQYVFKGGRTDEVEGVENAHYKLDAWSDGGTSSERSDIVLGDTTLTVNFTLREYAIEYSAKSNGTISGTTTQLVEYGSQTDSVTAVPAEGYHFVSWSDALKVARRADTVKGSASYNAAFAIDTLTLTYTATTGGSINGTATQKVTYGSNGTEVTAVPAAGYSFSIWSDGVESTNRTDLAVKADKKVEAQFELIGSTAKDDTLYFTEDVDSTVATKVIVLNDSLGVGTNHTVSEIITVTAPSVASVNLLNDSLYFSLTANASGDNSFKVVVKNSAGVADTANLIVKVAAVNDAPVLTAAKAQLTAEDTPLEVTLVMTDGSDIDNILKDGNVVLGTGANYTVSHQTITPAANFTGDLTVPVTISDGKLNSATVNMTVTVTPVNDAPILTAAAAQTTAEDTPLTVSLAMTDASDVDNVLSETGIILGAGANYTVVGQTVTPAANFTGTLTVPVAVTDGALNSATVNMTITVGGVNDAPILTATTAQTTAEDTPLALTTVMTNAVDPDGDALTLIVGAGANYTVSGTTITPTANFNGVLTVPVAVTDGALNSATVNMTVTITPVNDAPVLTAATAQVTKQETPLTVTLAMTNATDIDNALTDASIIVGTGANYVVEGTTITPVVGFVGILTVPVAVTDGALSSETVNMTITVEPTVAIVEADEKANGIGAFAVAPNIITDESEAHFVIGESLSGEGRIFVLDHLGDIIDEQDVSVEDGGHYYWDLTNSSGYLVTSGLYLVVLELDGKIYQRRIGIKK